MSQRSRPSSSQRKSAGDSQMVAMSQAGAGGGAPDSVPSTQGAAAYSSLSADIRQQLVTSLVQTFLAFDAQKLPLQSKDISAAMGPYNQKSVSSRVLESAKETLLRVFGFKVVTTSANRWKPKAEAVDEEDDAPMTQATQATQSSQAAGGGARKSGRGPTIYFLVNTLDAAKLGRCVERSPQQQRNLGLLMTVVSFILLKGEPITTDELWTYLEVVGVERKNDAVFGDVETLLLETMKNQAYLHVERMVVHNGISEVQTEERVVLVGIGARTVEEVGLRTSVLPLLEAMNEGPLDVGLPPAPGAAGEED